MICLFISSFICLPLLYFLLPNSLQLQRIGHYKSGQPLNQTCGGNASLFNLLLTEIPPPKAPPQHPKVRHLQSLFFFFFSISLLLDFSLKSSACASISRQQASGCSCQSHRLPCEPHNSYNTPLSPCSRSPCGEKSDYKPRDTV